MKLSEAICKGSELSKFITGSFVDMVYVYDYTEAHILSSIFPINAVFKVDLGTCALGAVAVAIHGKEKVINMVINEAKRGIEIEKLTDSIVTRYPELMKKIPNYLIPNEDLPLPCVFLNKIIVYLNDYKGWTREQIADWVESLEMEGVI